MSRLSKTVIPVAILTAGVFWGGATVSAKPEYAKTEGKACTYCHVTTGKPDLNDVGKYYGAHDHSLKGYTPAN